MTSNSGNDQGTPIEARVDAGSYEAPKLVVLGTFAELTQQGATPTDELLNDGSQI